MLQVDYGSDLHLDNAQMGGPYGVEKWIDWRDLKRGGDVLILAGDTANHVTDADNVANAAADHYKAVFYVYGNHETGQRTVVQRPNVYQLGDRDVLFDGVLFVGDTGVPGSTNDGMLAAVTNAQGNPNVRKIVVVTHYAPFLHIGSLLGIPNFEKHSNGALGQALLAADTGSKIAAFVFGHYHYHLEHQETSGRLLLSNPRGYRRRARDGKMWQGLKQFEV